MQTYFQIELTQGKVTRVDEDTWDKLSGRRLNAVQRSDGKKWYARLGSIKLHRFIMEPPADMTVDHISGDSLDNRRKNLRICSQMENLRNSTLRVDNCSGMKGVWPYKRDGVFTGQYVAEIQGEYIGIFTSKDLAFESYRLEADKRFGEFARLS